jgi:hypothetical protein
MAAANTDKLRKGKSLFSTTLSADITDSDTTIALNSASGLPTDTAVTLTIDRTGTREVVTGVISGNNLTNSVRAQGGSTAAAHSSGDTVEMIFEQEQLNDIVDWGVEEHNQDGTHSAITSTSIQATTADIDASYGVVTTYTPDAAGTATVNLAVSNRNNITMPAGNITIAISNETVGQVFTIRILQDGTGSRTVTWFTTIKWAGGSAPTLTTTANKADMFAFVCTGTDAYDGFIVGQNL